MLHLTTDDSFKVLGGLNSPVEVFVVDAAQVTSLVRAGDPVRINGRDYTIAKIERIKAGLLTGPKFAFEVR